MTFCWDFNYLVAQPAKPRPENMKYTLIHSPEHIFSSLQNFSICVCVGMGIFWKPGKKIVETNNFKNPSIKLFQIDMPVINSIKELSFAHQFKPYVCAYCTCLQYKIVYKAISF